MNIGMLATTIPWAALITAISTLVAGLGAVWITNHHNDQREARRLDHERKMKLRDDRQKAYATMARITKHMEVPEPYEIGDLADTHSEIEILTEDPRVLEAAEQLLHAASEARQARAHRNERENVLTKRWFEEAKEKLDQRRNEFINLARKELGQGPKPSMNGEELEQGQKPPTKAD